MQTRQQRNRFAAALAIGLVGAAGLLIRGPNDDPHGAFDSNDLQVASATITLADGAPIGDKVPHPFPDS
jgi:hypothetical protein